jgi:hypothetical protein
MSTDTDVRLSPATFSKFRTLKEYSLSFIVFSKRFRPLYFLHLQQRSLNLVLYIYSINRIYKLAYLFIVFLLFHLDVRYGCKVRGIIIASIIFQYYKFVNV